MKENLTRMLERIKKHDEYTSTRDNKLKIADDVLKIIETIPRSEFVPLEKKDFAYEDSPLSIGFGQTISQPYIVAFMTSMLQPKKNHKILEIGTGSGYQAAVLSKLVKEVYSVEIIKELSEIAKKKFIKLGYRNIFTKVDDGNNGWKEHAPFDGIIVTAAAKNIPKPLIEQLAIGGKMIIPFGQSFTSQKLFLIEKIKSDKTITNEIMDVRFVPLVGSS